MVLPRCALAARAALLCAVATTHTFAQGRSADHAPPLAPYGIHVSLERNEALAVEPNSALIGWAVPSLSAPHATFHLRLERLVNPMSATATAVDLLGIFECNHSPVPDCKASHSITIQDVVGGALPSGATLAVSIRLVDRFGAAGAWSPPFHFATRIEQREGSLGDAVPIWTKNATQNYVLLRRSFALAPTAVGEEHLVSITAHGVPVRMPHAGENATKLLCAYKLCMWTQPSAQRH